MKIIIIIRIKMMMMMMMIKKKMDRIKLFRIKENNV